MQKFIAYYLSVGPFLSFASLLFVTIISMAAIGVSQPDKKTDYVAVKDIPHGYQIFCDSKNKCYLNGE